MSGAAAWPNGFDPGPARHGVARGTALAVLLALLAHVVLFGLLSLLWRAPAPLPPETKPVEVSLVDAVALDQHAPSAAEPPAQSRAPEIAPPEEAPPAPAEQAAPEPTPAKPKPDAAPPPKPSPKPLSQPKPVAQKPATPAKAAPARPAQAAAKARATGSLLDDDFRKGLTQSPSKAKASDAAPGATMDAKAAADIGSAIQRQVQPCANRQINPGPGASRIVVTIRLQLNRDGTLAARPSVADDHGGVDDENRRYVDAVDRNAIATFTGCAPLRGLPPELYDVPRGWKTFILRYKLPG